MARSSSKRKSASDLASSVLPVPVGPEEQERAGGPVGVGDAGPRSAYGVAHRVDRRPLADQPLADDLLHLQQLGGLALEHPAGGDAGPGLDHLGDLLGPDLLADQRLERRTRSGSAAGRLDLLLERGDPAVEDLAGLPEVALALEPLRLDRAAGRAGGAARPRPRATAFSCSQRASSPRSSSSRSARSARSAASRSTEAASVSLASANSSILSRSTGAPELVDLLRGGLDLHPQPASGLVDQVDRLVGQLTAGDVAVGQGRGRHQRGVGDPHAVVGFVLLLDAAQDLDGVLDGRLTDEDLLEAALQRRVLLDPLAVLVEGGGTDHVQLAAGQHRLEHVAGVHRGVAPGARADDGVQLVDEGDHLPAGVLDLLEDGLEPLLELAAVLRPGDHRGQVEARAPGGP